MSDRATSLQPNERPAAAQSPLKVVEPQTLYERWNQLSESIARRAFQMFEEDGGILGHDVDHWFRAEAELLHPAHVNVTESDDALTVEAEVPGFSANELQVSLEPQRLTISGKKESRREEKVRKTVYQEQCSSELFRVVELPVEVNIAKATASLKNGILELNMPKAVEAKGTPVLVKSASSGT